MLRRIMLRRILDVDCLQPRLRQLRPASNWQLRAPQSIAVPAMGVKMHLGWNVGVLQSLKVHDGIFHVHRIVLRLNDKSRRSLAGDVNLRIRREILFLEREVARVDDQREIGTATDLVRRIDMFIKPLLEMRAESGSEVGSRGKSENPDPMGINVPLTGMRADDPQRSLRILQCSRRFGMRPGVGHAIFHQHASDADRIKPFAHLGPFEVDGQDVVSTSRKDDNSGPSIHTLRSVNRECGRRHVAEPDDWFTGDQVVFGGRRIDFRSRIRRSAGSTVRP